VGWGGGEGGGGGRGGMGHVSLVFRGKCLKQKVCVKGNNFLLNIDIQQRGHGQYTIIWARLLINICLESSTLHRA
jgi:hypothetical protein